MEIALETGSRPSAILDLTWSRIDFKQCRIDFNPVGRKRTAKARPTIPISPALRDRLLAAREHDKKNAKRKKRPLCDYVIAYAGYPVGSIKKAFRATAVEAGFLDVTPYVLRHTAATWMAQDGVALWDIAAYLGTSLKMVEEHYAHHHPDHMKKAVKAIAKAVAAVNKKAEPLSLRKGRKSRKEMRLLAAPEGNLEAGAGRNAGSESIVVDQRQLGSAPQMHHSNAERPVAPQRGGDKKRNEINTESNGGRDRD
ncbi:site-specific integrase [Dongia mobilis]|uniref:site-specific integrase n=1 Tax=Dongia mobilis TaxID=578943 RepID=UPI00105BCA06|nr:site-specific integrase [Dongia mobilis]